MGPSQSTDESSGDEGSSEELTQSVKEEGSEAFLAFMIMTFVIGGYTLIGPLQHHLKEKLQIGDEGSQNEIFTQSVAMVQWGKTFMTLGQNVLLSWCSHVQRVYIAMGAMLVGTLIPPVIIYGLGSLWIGWVPLSYLSIGFALGTFECTYLSVLAPLGERVKSFAIMGFPAAFALVNIFGQSFMALFNMPVVWIFWYIALTQPVAILLFRRIAPDQAASEDKGFKQPGILESLSDWQEWIPLMIPFCLVNIVSHFVMESVLPAIFNTYNGCMVSVWGPENHSVLMNTIWFLVVLSIMMAVTDMSSRRIGFMFQFNSFASNCAGLAFALCCCSLGLYLTIQGIAALSWFSVGLAFFGSGFNYAVSTKFIDKRVAKHNLAGYSLWMFVGYCGAISGAVLVTIVRGWICGSHDASLYKYQCLTHHPDCHIQVDFSNTTNALNNTFLA